MHRVCNFDLHREVALRSIIITELLFPSFFYHLEGWRMVPRKSWVSENVSPISESRQCFYRVSEARSFFLFGSEIA